MQPRRGQRRDDATRQDSPGRTTHDGRRPRYQPDSLARDAYAADAYEYEDAPSPPGAGWNSMAGADVFPIAGDDDEPEEDVSWLTGRRAAPPPGPGAPAQRRERPRQGRDAYRQGRDGLPPLSGSPGYDAPSPGAVGGRDPQGADRSAAPRPTSGARRLTKADRIAPAPVGAIPARERPSAGPHPSGVVVVPGGTGKHAAPAGLRAGLGRAGDAVGAVARRPSLLSVLVLVVVALGVLADVSGAAQQAGQFSAGAWRGLAGLAPWAAAPADAVASPTNFDAQHYMDKYGFSRPGAPTAIPGWEVTNLVQMAGPDIRAAAAYDKRYGKSIEPQLVMFWTHAEGIRGRISYSNCANQDQGGYFQVIQNCNHASFWQLGYGNQFSEIYVLRNAFTDLYGDPNDRQKVAQVGQGVLDFDRKQGTTPACGGYACTFPAKTIDEIMSGVNLNTGAVTEENWWASVLSRDPAINCYMIAHALTFFSHDATQGWVGCYYAAPCWQRISDRLGDVLAAWPDILKAAGVK